MRKTLLIITSDPRISGRAAEAIRMGAGVGAWKKIAFTVFLSGPAILAAGEWVDELVDEDCYQRYLPVLAENALAFYVDAASPHRLELGKSSIAFQELTIRQVVGLIPDHDFVLRL